MTQKASSCSMEADAAFQGSASGPLLELLDDTLALAQQSQITSKWIGNWETPDARADSLVNVMYQKIWEMEALTKAQVLAPQSEDLKREIERRKAEWDKCNVELLKGIAFKKITENETAQKEKRVLLTDVLQKETEIGSMRRKAEDDKLRAESLESQLAEKTKATILLELRVKTLARRLSEKEFIVNVGRRHSLRLEADAQSEEACRLAFLGTESRYSQLEKELSETPMKSVKPPNLILLDFRDSIDQLRTNATASSQNVNRDLDKLQVDSTGLAEDAQSEDCNLPTKSSSDRNLEPGGDVVQTEMLLRKHQVETKRMRDSEQREEPNVSVKRRILLPNVPVAGERKGQENQALEGELEVLTLEQYRDAMSGSTEKKKRLQPDVPEVADDKLTRKVRK